MREKIVNMEIKDIELVLKEALANPKDVTLKEKYCTCILDYCKNRKSSDELVTIVVQGIDIDQASSYFDYLESVSKNDIQSIWKQIRENKTVLENKQNNGVKLISGVTGLSLMKTGQLESISGSVVTKLMNMVFNEKKPVARENYEQIIMDYLVEMIAPLKSFPQWESMKLSGTVYKKFAGLLLDVTVNKQNEYERIRQWASAGMKYADKVIEEEEIESKIPKSKIEELTSITEHYKEVEKQIRESVYENVKLGKTIDGLRNDIIKLNIEKKELELKVGDINKENESLREKIDDCKKEISERKKINEAADALKKNDEEGLLKDIANSLKAEYRDFLDSVNDDIDEVLGEIYREKLKNIFKILKSKGIRME